MVANARNILQSNDVSCGQAVDVWKVLLETYRENGSEYREWLECAERRYSKSVPVVWMLANVLHPEHIGAKLTPKELKDVKDYVAEFHPEALPEFIDFLSEGSGVMASSFKKASGCKVESFLKVCKQTREISEKIADLSLKMLRLIPSTAGLERVFSTMGFVHCDLRNRLDPEKVGKLAFCLRALKSE